MKKILLLSALALILFAGCRNTYQTYSAGKENASFILITTDNRDYKHNISVIVDNNQPILVDKVFTTKKKLQAKPIETTPGKHALKIMQGATVLYNQDIFVGLQETKTVILK
jgi:hypothetical protein